MRTIARGVSLVLLRGYEFMRNLTSEKAHITTDRATALCGKVLHPGAERSGHWVMVHEACKRCVKRYDALTESEQPS